MVIPKILKENRCRSLVVNSTAASLCTVPYLFLIVSHTIHDDPVSVEQPCGGLPRGNRSFHRRVRLIGFDRTSWSNISGVKSRRTVAQWLQLGAIISLLLMASGITRSRGTCVVLFRLIIIPETHSWLKSRWSIDVKYSLNDIASGEMPFNLANSRSDSTATRGSD